jgi:pyruvate,water dikinase
MRAILDLITPLNLIDADSPAFSPEGCRTFHDIIRYCHEQAVREMFGISASAADSGTAVKLASRLPLRLYLVDLGGGLHGGMATGGDVTAEQIACRPLAALWRGFTHPGVSWEGTMNTGADTLAGQLAAPATAELGEQPGGDSYAVVSADYVNFSAKFAFHFSTIDALCGDNSSQNYISLQFSGGAGSYYGRSLRVQLMANILERLGFQVTVNGDLLQSTFARSDRDSTAERLDLLGRLLASSKLLDMTLSSQEEIAIYCDRFFQGHYDFLSKDKGTEPRSLYVQGGQWARLVEDGHVYCVQDGAHFRRRIAARIAGVFAKVMGMSYYQFLDNIETHYFFPLAIAKDSEIASGTASVLIRPVSGKFDEAGGIAFGIRNRDNYFVVRINALEGNICLFEFRNGRRHKQVVVERTVDTNEWHRLQVKIQGTQFEASFNGEPVIRFETGTPLAGFIGLWTTPDSTTWFDRLEIDHDGIRRTIEF